MKVADVAPAATVSDFGMYKIALLSDNATVAPPVGAAWPSVTLHVLRESGPKLVGLQDTEDIGDAALKRLTLVLAELLLYVAVTVALELLPTAAVVTLNVAEAAPAPTVAEAGTFNVALLFESETTAPPDGADGLRVTVHVPEAFDLRLVGLHETAVTDTEEAARLTVALTELLL